VGFSNRRSQPARANHEGCEDAILLANLQRDHARIATRRVSADDGRGEERRGIPRHSVACLESGRFVEISFPTPTLESSLFLATPRVLAAGTPELLGLGSVVVPGQLFTHPNDGIMQLGSQKSPGWQRSQILGYADLALFELQEFNLLFVLGTTKNQA
jgi:hypothetical protein